MMNIGCSHLTTFLENLIFAHRSKSVILYTTCNVRDVCFNLGQHSREGNAG